MKIALVSTFVLLAAQSSQAGWFDKDFKKSLASLENSKKEAQASIDRTTKQKEYLERNLKNCADSRTACPVDGSEEKKLKSGIKEAEEAVKKFQTDVANIDKKIATTKTEETAANEKKAKEDAEEAQKQLEPFKKNATMLKEDVLNLKFEVSDLGRALDRQWIGSYVAAKMGLMLNSQSFCDSMVRCAEPKGQASRKVSPEQLKKEIFSGLDSDLFKGVDFWQKAHEGGKPSAPAPKAAGTPTK